MQRICKYGAVDSAILCRQSDCGSVSIWGVFGLINQAGVSHRLARMLNSRMDFSVLKQSWFQAASLRLPSKGDGTGTESRENACGQHD